MFDALQKLVPKSPFAKNVLTLMTGTTIAQAIPVAISPILTRIYSPEDFGVLALFISVTTILGSIINGRYELAVILPEKDEEARVIVGLCILISLVVSLLLLLFICPFHSLIIEQLNNSTISMWIYMIPLVVFLIGVFNALNYYYSRKKRFKNIAQANVTRSFGLASGQLLLPMIKEGAFGLVMGRIVSTFIAPFYLWLKISDDAILFNRKKMRIAAKRYIDFPKYAMWAGLFNNLALYFNNLLIPAVYSTSILGYYALLNRVLAMPFNLIGNSVGQVFFKEISDVKNANQDASKIVWKIVKKLGAISLLGFGLLFFIAEDLFAFVFGEEWRISGIYAKHLIPMFMIKFVVSPITIVHSVFEKLKLSLLLQTIMFVISLFVILSAKFLNFDFKQFLSIFSTLLSLFYLTRLIIVFRIVKTKNE